jgi:hypothetical protein
MRYRQVRTSGTDGTQTTLYLDKLVEITISGNTTKTQTFIGDVAIVSKIETTGSYSVHKIAFTHRDRLGYVVTLTDNNNNLIENRSYDPFGKPRSGDFIDASIPTLASVVGASTYTTRGFTDHEHLDDAQLIHMNGRVIVRGLILTVIL